jgi:hypothetical protein
MTLAEAHEQWKRVKVERDVALELLAETVAILREIENESNRSVLLARKALMFIRTVSHDKGGA